MTFLPHSDAKKLLNVLLLAGILGIFVIIAGWAENKNKDYPEVAELSGTHWKSADYENYFEDLATTKGARYSYEVLARTEFPPGIDLHLLGHVVGGILYREEGIQGITACTQNFRNACSHSIVVGLFSERGVGALPDIVDVCKHTPGGSGAYSRCFHGLGHGVLAYEGYDLEQALLLCKDTSASLPAGSEFVDCVGGVVMEMISGIYDPAAGNRARIKYFKDDDPLYPCDADFMPPEVQPICYIYLTPHLFRAVGNDLASPIIEDLPKSFALCEKIPEENQENRDACFGGFGKEFTSLVVGQDVRDIGSMGADKVRLIREWCDYAGTPEGTNACTLTALRTLFWGGDNNPDAAFILCEISRPETQHACFAELASQIERFLSGDARASGLCKRLPEPHRMYCRERIEQP